MASCIRFLIGAVVALMVSVVPLAAETVPEALRRGDAAAARAALETQIAGRKDAGLHRAHLEGLIAMRQGDYAKAAQIFRAILQVAPGFEPSQLQLVRALDHMGQRRAAILHARRLAEMTEDARLRDQLLDQIASADAGRAGGVALRFSLLPSSNITGGTGARTVLIGGLPFTLDPASREASGLGLNLGATAWRTWALGRDWRATLSASADERLFSTALKPDETELGLRLDLSHRGPRGGLSFGPRLSVLFQDGSITRRQAGVGLTGDYLLGPRHRLSYSLEWLDQGFPGASYRDGTRASAVFGMQWALSQDTFLSVEVPLLRETAVADHLAHTDIGLGLGIETKLQGGLSVGLGILASKNSYDGIYPGFSVARKDDVGSLRLSLSHPRIKIGGLTPEISITRKHQSSNIPLHDTWTTDFGLSFSKRF